MLCRTRRAGNCDLVIDGLRAIASSPEPSFQTPGKKMPRNSEAFAILAWNLEHQFQQSRRAESVLTFSFQAEHFGVREDPGCAPCLRPRARNHPREVSLCVPFLRHSCWRLQRTDHCRGRIVRLRPRCSRYQVKAAYRFPHPRTIFLHCSTGSQCDMRTGRRGYLGNLGSVAER